MCDMADDTMTLPPMRTRRAMRENAAALNESTESTGTTTSSTGGGGATATTTTGYSLRDHSKPPSRYRDFVADPTSGGDNTISGGGADSPRQLRASPGVRTSMSVGSAPKRGRGRPSPSKQRASIYSSSSQANTIVQVVDDDVDSNSSLQRSGRGKSKKENSYTMWTENDLQQPPDADDQEEQQQQIAERPRRQARIKAAGQGGGITDLSATLKENLKRLKNVLKLPKARRWVYCEFFYSGVDQQLFLGDNEFSQCLRESFPNLKCRTLTRIEWRTIRRLIGKPRRCSQAFLDEERAALEQKRAKIRHIYEGTLVTMTADMADLPTRMPRPLVVGAKIYARVRSPKDGIYSGTIDAVLPDSYRVVFDKEEMIPAMLIKDSEVMSEASDELVALAYFLEQNRASMPNAMIKLGPTAQFMSPTKILGMGDQPSPLLKHDPMITSAAQSQTTGGHKFGSGITPRRATGVRDEKVGNFPVRMLVMLVKLAKLIEMKRGLVRQLTELNTESERMNLLADHYPTPFQMKYAQVVVDLETINKQMSAYLIGINEYNAMLLPHLSEVTVTARPEALRKLCHTHAVQIVKHCNHGLNVQSRRSLDLVTSLTALLLQVRSLGQQRCTAFDLHTLSESLAEIRLQIAAKNAGAFQDCVEIHVKQIHTMMLHSGASA